MTWSKRKTVILIAVALFVLLWPWVYMISCVGYTYGYWLFPNLTWANPGEVPSEESLPVPALIHQTWKTQQVPEKWAKAQQSCIDLHPDYEYKLWTDDDGLELIQNYYPWFLPTYLSYPYAIQRVDAVRYFILHKYGGIYIDLDMGCLKRLDFMRAPNFTAPLTYPVGISNDVMAARPGDAYIYRVITHLSNWNHWLFIQYVQVMFSTGPMFLTVQYALSSHKLKHDVAVIPAPTYGKYDFSGDPTFYHLHGSSWHADDAAFVFWLDKYKHVLLVVGVVSAAGAGAVWWSRRQRRGGAQKIPTREPPFDVEKQF